MQTTQTTVAPSSTHTQTRAQSLGAQLTRILDQIANASGKQAAALKAEFDTAWSEFTREIERPRG